MTRTVLWFVIILTVLNIAAFVVECGVLDGAAIAGRIANGHYYLGNHGRLREVDAQTYTFNLWHMWSIVLLQPFMIMAAVLLKQSRPT